MKSLWTVLMLSGMSLVAMADVTKEDLRRLLAAGVSDETIVEYVQKNGPVRPLSAQDLAELKSAGASDSVLGALVSGMQSPDVSPPAVEPPVVVTEGPPSYSYSYVYPYYVPYTIYPSFSYSRFYRPYPHHHYYYGQYGRAYRPPPRGVAPYRQPTIPRTPPPSSRPAPTPPRSHGPYR